MQPADAFPPRKAARAPLPRRSLRRWSVRHAAAMSALWRAWERVLQAADPLFARIGRERLERPVARLEHAVKSALFDCRMCGQCVLSSTGMSCPMNCPKNLRNGPCGGVRADGHCEVHPAMPCVWVEAFAGAQRMNGLPALSALQPPLDHRRTGGSSWLEAARSRRSAHVPS